MASDLGFGSSPISDFPKFREGTEAVFGGRPAGQDSALRVTRMSLGRGQANQQADDTPVLID